MLCDEHAYEVLIKTAKTKIWGATVRVLGHNFDVTLDNEKSKRIADAIDRALEELCREEMEKQAREEREKRREEAIEVYTRNARRLID
ncbi:MAG: hypothetical protein J6K25_15895 [Thermoguttaceae bacterium]|nr:hypothetical protein [Thermoguttaceae bacterium]MBP3532638.1 hypothetical protein [Thermoguttaceae bacterium]